MTESCRGCGTPLSPGRFFGRASSQVAAPNAILTNVVHPQGRALPVHEHELGYFAMLVRGSYSEWTGNRELRYGAYETGFHPACTGHRDVIGAGGEFVCLELKAANVEGFRLREDVAMLPASVSVQLARLHHALARGTLDAIQLESVAWELCGDAAREPPPRERAVPRWLARALDLIEARYAEPLTVAAIAAEVGVHPVHAAREFRRRFGRTIGEYVNHARLRRACAEIVSDARSLAEIAIGVGFSDQPHFCRVFKASLGCTPSAFAISAPWDGTPCSAPWRVPPPRRNSARRRAAPGRSRT